MGRATQKISTKDLGCSVMLRAVKRQQLWYWFVGLWVLVWQWGFGLAPIHDVSAFQVMPINLEKIAKNAERIFVGICTARREGELSVGKSGRLAYMEYTFEVKDVIKGNIGKTLTIRQVNLAGSLNKKGPSSEQAVSTIVPLLPLPDYQLGAHLLLALATESASGLTSPMGVYQGVFEIEASANRQFFVHSPMGYQVLFGGMSVQGLSKANRFSKAELDLIAEAPGRGSQPMPYAPFVSLMKKLSS